MEVALAPPPPPGSRIQELGDDLIVQFRPRRSWGELAFLTIWLLAWTAAGIAVLFALLHADWGERVFIAVWLCGWLLGECVAIAGVLWPLFGREVLMVTAQELVVREQIGRFGRTKRYDAELVEDLRAALVPSGEDEKPRKDFCLQFSHGGRTVRVGEGMGEREAEYVVATVLARIRPRARWSDEPYAPNDRSRLYGSDDDRTEAVSPTGVSTGPSTPRRRWRSALFPMFVVACFAAIVLSNRDGSPTQNEPLPPTNGFPAVRDFSGPREYAAAVTVYTLTAADTEVLRPPDCGQHVTWTEWTCTAQGRALSGGLAGRIMTYRCFPTSVERSGGRAMVASTECGLASPPRPLVRSTPSTREFSKPRDYATAMTVYALRSAGTTVLRLPDCGKRVTWTGWSCVATARASAGPFVGRALTYRCAATSSEQTGGRPEVRGVLCDPVDPPPIR